MNTVLDLLQAKGITAKKVSGHKSGEYHSPCPCDPKSRDRFHVWPEQNEGNVSWWCRSCNTKETLESAGKILVVLDFDKAGLKGWTGIA